MRASPLALQSKPRASSKSSRTPSVYIKSGKSGIEYVGKGGEGVVVDPSDARLPPSVYISGGSSGGHVSCGMNCFNLLPPASRGWESCGKTMKKSWPIARLSSLPIIIDNAGEGISSVPVELYNSKWSSLEEVWTWKLVRSVEKKSVSRYDSHTGINRCRIPGTGTKSTQLGCGCESWLCVGLNHTGHASRFCTVGNTSNYGVG